MKNLIITLLLLLSTFTAKVHSNSASAVTSLKQTKSILEFHQAFIQNPQSLIMLHADIIGLFRNSNPRYRGFNNELAEKLGLVKNLQFSGLKKVAFSSEPLNGNPDQAYSVTFREISFKDCLALSNHPVNEIFIKVYINNNEAKAASCKKKWFFQRSKNTVKYIGR